MSLESKQSKKLRIIVGAVLMIVGVFAVFFVDWGKDQKAEPPPVRPLKMIQIGQTSLPPVREYPGKMTAKDTVAIAFQVGGQVVEFPILKGQKVNKGDVLAKLDERDYKNRYNAAKAEYEKTKAQLERIQKAVESGAVSETDLTNAQADFQLAQANQDIAQKALDDTILRAPYDAVISNTFVENFEDVLAKQPVAGVQDIGSIEVEAIVPQERIMKAKGHKGMFRFTTTFDSLPDREFDVEVKEYTTEADPLTQTYTVTFTMPAQDSNQSQDLNEYNIFPGMTATVREYPIEEAFPDSGRFLVPIDAAPVDGQGQYYVWKVKEQDGKLSVHRQDVTVGNAMGDEIEILEGLNIGDRIAAQGVSLLQEEQQVREYKLKGEKQK